MGIEAGEELSQIFRRKELERQATGGLFTWGIGNGVRPGIEQLRVRDGEPEVLFSPIRSSAAAIDRSPSGLLLWPDYYDDRGETRPLPEACLVTSRSDTSTGTRKRAHYALFCASDAPLKLARTLEISFGQLRNLGTQRRLGFSQVTAVVERLDNHRATGPAYEVSLSASLVSPFCVKLANPVLLTNAEIALLTDAGQSDSSFLWSEAVKAVKMRAASRNTAAQ